MSLTPVNDGILVRPDSVEEKTPGGIVLPDQAQEAPQRGVVLSVGPGPRTNDGSRVAMDVKKGDRVLFAKFGGTKIYPDGQDGEALMLLREHDILAKEE